MKRKRLILSFGIMVIFFVGPVVSHATESQDYQSNGKVSFFGKYVNPGSEGTSESGNSSSSVSGEKDPTHALEKIPQTGDTSHFEITILGALFTVSAIFLIRKYKNIQWRASL
ncbi:sortase B cell surface sorting signal [Bacillus cereus BAG6X1-2]|nr:sortase B cell surface sorting signal [Bacillus cereus BAG6X1-2]